MNETSNPFDRLNQWIKHSVMLKLLTISFLVLVLLIPASMIENIIYERESLNQATIQEVSSKWANSQEIKGPILSIPMVFVSKDKEEEKEYTRFQHFLPEDLNINGAVNPEPLRRGIYEVIVYKSDLKINGSFLLEAGQDYNNLKEIQWDKAFLTIGISDLRGIEDQVTVNWNGQPLKVKPGSRISNIVYSGVTVDLPNLSEVMNKNLPFEFDMKLQGSQSLSFIPVGSQTNVQLQSPWTSPSFNGNFLPDERNLHDQGFDANWKVLQLNRNFPQSWLGDEYANSLQSASFGVNLLPTLDDYQKSMRSAKYAIMTIALTFLIFFLVEILNRRKIHPFQYTLVGLALCLFYVLLVSISEHLNFNDAYAISSATVVVMIALYSVSVFRVKKLTALLSGTLTAIYSFLFVTLQLADYALLMGSIGLAVILSITMYFTRNINWYKLNVGNEEGSNGELVMET